MDVPRNGDLSGFAINHLTRRGYWSMRLDGEGLFDYVGNLLRNRR